MSLFPYRNDFGNTGMPDTDLPNAQALAERNNAQIRHEKLATENAELRKQLAEAKGELEGIYGTMQSIIQEQERMQWKPIKTAPK